MTDIVISGRINKELMAELRKLGKTNTEILNEALTLYLAKITTKEPCIQTVYKKTGSYDSNTAPEYIDVLKPVNPVLDKVETKLDRLLRQIHEEKK